MNRDQVNTVTKTTKEAIVAAEATTARKEVILAAARVALLEATVKVEVVEATTAMKGATPEVTRVPTLIIKTHKTTAMAVTPEVVAVQVVTVKVATPVLTKMNREVTRALTTTTGQDSTLAVIVVVAVEPTTVTKAATRERTTMIEVPRAEVEAIVGREAHGADRVLITTRKGAMLVPTVALTVAAIRVHTKTTKAINPKVTTATITRENDDLVQEDSYERIVESPSQKIFV